ncbi:MAG: hypothetical protein CVU97_05090 [Firmicutes bacterium HGW-Firmicutes-21]|nr:MAG: hypothetical protein CVU97_05090 [Firmicutes bacterium HGW-Firmicutes-21]
MRTHSNIPFFIPHSGCNNSCVFCSQVKITGRSRTQPVLEEEIKLLKQTVEESLSTLPKGIDVQLAFFGGSFTGIEPDRMTALLEAGYRYIEDGRIKGIRISTRPDYINEKILAVLKRYGVTDIELGIQSINDRVLEASARGHNSSVSYKSAEQIKKHSLGLVGQMMIGLPLSTLSDELNTADAIIKMGAYGARIYPTVVFADTTLYDMTIRGLYAPLTDDEAVERSALCLNRFIASGVRVLKIGLHSTESLAEAKYGANHPAIGELVKARVYYHRLCEELRGYNCHNREAVIYIKDGERSKLTGHGGRTIKELKDKFGLKNIEIMIANTQPYHPIIKVKE